MAASTVDNQRDANASTLLSTTEDKTMKVKNKQLFSQPQDTGYSWVVLAASFMLALHYSCLLSHFGIFLVEYMEYFDVRKSSLVWIGSLLTSIGFIFGNISSLLIRKYGFRKFGFAAGFGACVSFVVTACAPNVAVLYLGSGIFASLSFINMFLMSMVAVQCYFDKKRSLASGIHTAGLSVGVFIWPFVSRMLIDHYGWRGAMAILGAMQLQTLVYTALIRPITFAKRHEKESKPRAINGAVGINATADEKEQLSDIQHNSEPENVPKQSSLQHKSTNCVKNMRSTCSYLMYSTIYPLKKFPAFQVGLTGFVLMQCGYINFYMMCPALASDFGISKDLGGTIVSIFGAVNGVCRVAIGYIADRNCMDSTMMLAVGGIFGGLLSVFSLFYTEYLHLVLFATFYAISSATYMVLVTPVVRGMVGIEHLPAAVGTVAFFIGFDHLITIFIAGILYDWTDSAGYNFVLYGIVQIVSGFVFAVLSILQRKMKSKDLEIREIELKENGESV